jgi:hypothetical protein
MNHFLENINIFLATCQMQRFKHFLKNMNLLYIWVYERCLYEHMPSFEFWRQEVH